MSQARDGALVRHGAVWLTMLGMAIGGISWVFGVAGQVKNQQEQIAALQAEVANRRGAMTLIEDVQRDMVRLEQALGRVDRILDMRGELRAKLAQIEEHLRTVDDRVRRLEKS